MSQRSVGLPGLAKPNGAGRIELRPVTRTVTTTTVTTTTHSFPPLFVPQVLTPSVLSDAERATRPVSSRIGPHQICQDDALDPKLFPLARIAAPEGLASFQFGVGEHEALFTGYIEPDTSERQPSLSPGTRRKASSAALDEPKRKRARAEQSASTERANEYAPASPISDIDQADVDGNMARAGHGVASSMDVAALMSLPSIVEQFSILAPTTQSFVLFNLLKRSSVPVLQRVSRIIEPALKRDFLSDLPLELVTAVLCCLDGRALCVASRVSKTWQQRISGDGRAWLAALRAEDLFQGHGSEERDANRLLGKSPASPEETFFKHWASGLWKADFDQAAAAVPAVEKIAAALGADRRRKASLSPATKRRMSDPSSPMLFGPHIAPRLTDNSTHPYKLLYKERLVRRRRWLTAEPRRITFAGHSQSTVTCLQFDRKRIVSASDEHLINVFQTTTGKALARLEGHEGGVWALQYLGNILVSGSTDRTVRVWDLNRMKNTHTFVGHTSTVRCLQIIEPVNINPDLTDEPVWEPPYPLIVTGSRDCTLRTWRLPSPTRDDEFHPFVPLSPSEDESHFDTSKNPWHLRHFTGHRQAVRALAAHGRTFISGSYDFTVRVWDALSGECRHILEGHNGKIYSVVLDAARERCASGSMDGNVRLWTTKTGECLRNLEGHTSLVGLLGLSAHVLISAAADATLRLWRPDTGECTAILSAHAGAITCFQHDEYKVISGSDGTLKLWDVKTGQFMRDLLESLSGVWQCAFDERYCVAAVQRNARSEFEGACCAAHLHLFSSAGTVLDFGADEPAPVDFDDDDENAAPQSSPIARIGDPDLPTSERDDSTAPYVYDEPVYQDSPLARVASRRTTGALPLPEIDAEASVSAGATDDPFTV